MVAEHSQTAVAMPRLAETEPLEAPVCSPVTRTPSLSSEPTFSTASFGHSTSGLLAEKEPASGLTRRAGEGFTSGMSASPLLTQDKEMEEPDKEAKIKKR